MSSIESLYSLFLKHRRICTDTRKITENSLFFALKGENFDANTFAETALASGAAYAIVDNIAYKSGDRCILVPDVLSALQDLARHHRNQLNIPVIGLTGTNGKTTTKELIKSVLAERYQVFATSGNLNNHIGVPLSLLAIEDTTEIAVIEMGANHQKEIEFLCGISQPSHGLITNVGLAHLEGFGGFEGVKKGKGELYAYLNLHGGMAFVNRDNFNLMEMNEAHRLSSVTYYGSDDRNEIFGHLTQSDPLLKVEWGNKKGNYSVNLNITGAYNFENVLAAIAIGNHFGLSPEQINVGLSRYVPQNNRSQINETEHNTIICDFYNANPSSMAAALKNLSALDAEKKTIIIGDMFELGEEASAQHELIANMAAELHPDRLLFIGNSFWSLRDRVPGTFFLTTEDAEAHLRKQPVVGNLILLKGSRGMALERLMPLL